MHLSEFVLHTTKQTHGIQPFFRLRTTQSGLLKRPICLALIIVRSAIPPVCDNRTVIAMEHVDASPDPQTPQSDQNGQAGLSDVVTEFVVTSPITTRKKSTARPSNR